jgi:hypothetical protein
MPGFLRQSTASQSRALGPFVDDTDFKTAETALTINNTDIKLIVNGAASANKNSGGGTHRANGVYGVTFDATDTATVGEMQVSVLVAGALLVFDKFTILEEAVYDALLAAAAPGYGVAQTGDSFARIGAAGAGLTAIDLPDQTMNITGNITGNLSGSVGSVTADVGITQAGADKVWASAARTLTSFGTLVADVATAVWGAATRLLTAGTNIVLAKGVGVTGFNDPTVGAIADQVWDEALSGHAIAGSTGAALSAAGSAGDPWITALPGAYVAGTAGYIIGHMTGSIAGAGAITWTYTLTNSSSGLPIADANVWVSSDAAGLNILASGVTDQSGVVTFFLDAGTVYVWRQKSGFNFQNPDSEVVA